MNLELTLETQALSLELISPEVIELTIEPVSAPALSLEIGPAVGVGSGQLLAPRILNVTHTGQTVWDLGMSEPRKSLWINGNRYFEGESYSIVLPLLTWFNQFPIKLPFSVYLTT